MEHTSLLLLLSSSILSVAGVRLKPCGNDSIWEIPAGQKTTLTCKAAVMGDIRWYLSVHDTETQERLAICLENVCHTWSYDERIFKAHFLDSLYTTMTIDAVDINKIYNSIHRVNGTLYCYRGNGLVTLATSESCGLNYISPPNDVSCTAANTQLFVNVTCVIGSVYSSRSIYRCQLIRLKQGLKNETLNTITMVTSPTTKKIAKTQMMVSGTCQFNTTLPPEEGNYSFYVSVSPSRQTYSATSEDKWISVDLLF